MRAFSLLDRCIDQFDQLLALTLRPALATRPNPGDVYDEALLKPQEKKQVIALMRINHAGEIAAQGLYQGQALTAHSEITRAQMEAAALEEIDHLAWCRQRLAQLGGRHSYLDPLWYLGSLAIGASAGIIGDRWSLGFIAETERQVSAHLQRHLTTLPTSDLVSKAILSTMQSEEQAHAAAAVKAGARLLPRWLQWLMHGTSKIMVLASAKI